jgi:AAHS family benzoate transporter-like MFS transporter
MLGLCIGTFFSFGIVLVLVGANQAALADAMQLDLEQTGMLGAALALGAGVGIMAAGPVFDRYARRPLFALSALLPAVALLSVHAEMTFAGAFARIVVSGLGAGAYNTVVNATIAEKYGARGARPLAVVHSSATVGAMLAPLTFVWLESLDDWTLSFRIAGAAHVLVAIAAALTRDWGTPRPAAQRRSVNARTLTPFLCIVFGYVAIEGTATVFAVPYAMTHLELDASRGQLAISGLWLGVLVGRIGLIALGKRVGMRAIAGAGAATLVVVLVAVLSDWHVVELVFAAIGCSVGSIYPLTMALIGERFPEARGTATGIAGGAGAAGAVIAPWVTGAVGDRVGIGLAVASMSGWALMIIIGALYALLQLRE